MQSFTPKLKQQLRHEGCSFSEIQGEIERKLKTKFQIDEKEIAQIPLDYSAFTLPIKSRHKVAVVDADPDDEKFIECALASKAGYIVSGDKHLLN